MDNAFKVPCKWTTLSSVVAVRAFRAASRAHTLLEEPRVLV